MVWPVTKEASAEQSQTIALATSSESAGRPIGTPAVTSSRSSGDIEAIAGVSTIIGQTALALRPSSAYSSATDRVRPITPCLLAL